MLLTLGHSPDPDDAFMFYALAEHKIDTGRWKFEHILQDIQTLNERATRGEMTAAADGRRRALLNAELGTRNAGKRSAPSCRRRLRRFSFRVPRSDFRVQYAACAPLRFFF